MSKQTVFDSMLEAAKKGNANSCLVAGNGRKADIDSGYSITSKSEVTAFVENMSMLPDIYKSLFSAAKLLYGIKGTAIDVLFEPENESAAIKIRLSPVYHADDLFSMLDKIESLGLDLSETPIRSVASGKTSTMTEKQVKALRDAAAMLADSFS